MNSIISLIKYDIQVHYNVFGYRNEELLEKSKLTLINSLEINEVDNLILLSFLINKLTIDDLNNILSELKKEKKLNYGKE